MPSISRRTVLASTAAAVAATGGCTALASSDRPAHTVSVYLGDRDRSHDVTVTVDAADGSELFEKEYQLSDSNEADEDATFPASTDPETVVVTIDGTRFERDWPGIESSELPCGDGTNAGIEVWVEYNQDGAPTVRLEANCQTVMVE